MSTKFLPFVTEAAPITTVYKKIVNDYGSHVEPHILLSIAARVLLRGIDDTRKELQGKLTPNSYTKAFCELLQEDGILLIPRDVYEILNALNSVVPPKELEPLLTQGIDDLRIAYILAKYKKSASTPLGIFENLTALNSNAWKENFHSHNLFHEEGEKLYINDIHDLKAYVFYKMCLQSDESRRHSTPVKVVLRPILILKTSTKRGEA